MICSCDYIKRDSFLGSIDGSILEVSKDANQSREISAKLTKKLASN